MHGGRGLIPVPPHGPVRQHHAHAHAPLRRGSRLSLPPPPFARVSCGAPLPGPPVPGQPADRPAARTAARARTGDGRLGPAARQRAHVAPAAPAAAALEAVVALGTLVVAAAGRGSGPLGVVVGGVVLEVLFVRFFGGVLLVRSWERGGGGLCTMGGGFHGDVDGSFVWWFGCRCVGLRDGGAAYGRMEQV